jgi:hypothetical protein
MLGVVSLAVFDFELGEERLESRHALIQRNLNGRQAIHFSEPSVLNQKRKRWAYRGAPKNNLWLIVISIARQIVDMGMFIESSDSAYRYLGRQTRRQWRCSAVGSPGPPTGSKRGRRRDQSGVNVAPDLAMESGAMV